MLIEFIKPDFSFDDERGSLRQLVSKGYTQFNIVTSKSGVIRGNHYHKENRELFYVISGSFALDVSKDGISEHYEMKEGDMFLVPPYVMHSFYYTEDTCLAGLDDLGVEHSDGTKDIYTE